MQRVQSRFSMCNLSARLAVVLALGVSTLTGAHAQSSDTPRAVLDKSLKITGLTAPDAPAFHIRANYSLYERGNLTQSGVLEEWSTGPNTWRRSYAEKKLNGSEWSVTATKRVQSKDKINFALLDQRVGTPLINPLVRAANFKPDVELDLKAGTFAGLTLDCVSVVNPGRYAAGVNPDLLFPMLCFDVKDASLHFARTPTTLTTYSDFKPLGNRSVATKMEVNTGGKISATAEITLLETLPAADQAQVTPPGNAQPQPFAHQPWDAPLVPLHISECTYPMEARVKQVLGSVAIPVLIRKDGSVKNNGPASGPGELASAASDCVGNWKFEPFKVDGEPVDVTETLIYTFDGKPFKGVIGYGSQPAPPPSK